jgi:hypothetical protein
MLSEYRTRLAGYGEAELVNELATLKRLMDQLTQEHMDRAETLWLVSQQMDHVRTRLADYEEAPF